MHCVLLTMHPMLGVDIHKNFMPIPAPPTVAPDPMHPHIVAHVLYGWTLGKNEASVKAMGLDIIYMGSDIANGIPHIPMPPTHFLLFALYTLASGSKSHFGPAGVQGPDGPIGAALALVVNPNLNCFEICPMPVGHVVAPNTVLANMTLGDVLGGLFAMGVDMAIGAALNAAGDKLGGSGFSGAIRSPLMQFMVGSPLGKSAFDVIKAVVPKSWEGPLDALGNVPGFPGSVGIAGSGVSDAARGLGYVLGDAISGAETPTDRLFGRGGSSAASSAQDIVHQPANASGMTTPADAVIDNPSVEEF